MILPRRKFLTGLAALVAAPAIVKASSLMPVKSYDVFRIRLPNDYQISNLPSDLKIGDVLTFSHDKLRQYIVTNINDGVINLYG